MSVLRLSLGVSSVFVVGRSRMGSTGSSIGMPSPVGIPARISEALSSSRWPFLASSPSTFAISASRCWTILRGMLGSWSFELKPVQSDLAAIHWPHGIALSHLILRRRQRAHERTDLRHSVMVVGQPLMMYLVRGSSRTEVDMRSCRMDSQRQGGI